MSSPPPTERGSLRDTISRLLGRPEGSGSIANDPERTSLLDAATRSAEDLLERWTDGEAVQRLFGGLQPDILTTEGQWTTLEARFRATPFRERRAQFVVDAKPVGESAIDAAGEARVTLRAPVAGVYRVSVSTGRGAAAASFDAVLQVADDRPTLLVDAELVLAQELTGTEFGAIIRHLHDSGIATAYVDINRAERRSQIRERLQELGLPAAAVLSYDADTRNFEQLGVDLGQVLAATAVRGLRARGVAVAGLLTDRSELFRNAVEAVQLVSPSTFAPGARPAAVGAMKRWARSFQTARKRVDAARWQLDCVSGTHVVRGNRAAAELDNGRARERVFALIETSRKSIEIQTYILEPSIFAEQLVARLIRKAREGVQVRFMVDALYSDQSVFGRNNALLQALSDEPGIETLALGPIVSPAAVDVPSLKKRDHRKLMVFDEAVAIVSGRNAGDQYYQGFDEVAVHDQTPHERIPWLDAHLELEGPIVALVRRDFVETWNTHGGPPLALAGAPPKRLRRRPGVDARLVIHRGLRDVSCMATYQALFDTAERSVIIVNDFPIVSTLERAIRRALARGVKVDLLTGTAASRRIDGSFFPAPIHRTIFEHMVKARLEPLMLAGVRVHEFVAPEAPLVVASGGRYRPYVHAKIVSVDGRYCSIGSANLDETASFWESEAIVVIEDAAFAARLEHQLGSLIDASLAVDTESEYWKKERVERAVVGTLWPQWLYA
jgi:phosphatidylserine/phosphatidylglycerophosphate/cardiolipin synthase-like enzyme